MIITVNKVRDSETGEKVFLGKKNSDPFNYLQGADGVQQSLLLLQQYAYIVLGGFQIRSQHIRLLFGLVPIENSDNHE